VNQRSSPAALALSLVLVAFAATAHADPPSAEPSAQRLLVAAAQRPITVPTLVFEPQLGVDADRQGKQGTYGDLTVGAALGITDDLTARVVVLPLQLAAPTGSGLQYGQTTGDRGPSVGAVYRFVRGAVEIGAAFDLRVFTIPDLTGVALIPSVPIRIHAGEAFRVDVVPALNITRATAAIDVAVVAGSSAAAQSTPANATRLDIPIRALYNFTSAFDVGVNSGLTIYDLSETRNSTGIPAGAFVGYAIAGASGPVLQIEPYFNFPYLLMPGRADVTNSGQFVAGINVTGFLYW
jgi:hypothetical protein